MGDGYRPARGCCGSSAHHGAQLIFKREAHFGSCARRNDSVDDARQVIGPYPFAQGAFYALTPTLARFMAESPLAQRLIDAVLSGKWSFRSAEEDLFVGLLAHVSGDLRGVADWGKSVYHNLDVGSGAEAYYLRELTRCANQPQIALVPRRRRRWRR